MKLNCKRIDFTYTPGEEIFNFPEESGLPFIFDVEVILSILVDTFISKISLPMQPVPEIGSISVA